MRRVDKGQVIGIGSGVIGGVGVSHPIGDHRRDHDHDVKGVGQ
jgi:hypothetical protein